MPYKIGLYFGNGNIRRLRHLESNYVEFYFTYVSNVIRKLTSNKT